MTQDAGADAIHVSAFGSGCPIFLTSPKFVPAVIANLAEGIKKTVTIPVIAVGKITLEAGERMLREDKANLLAIGRALLADAEHINKAASGNSEDITPCIDCCGCLDSMMPQEPEGTRCWVNAALGKEKEFRIIPTKRPKKVLIIGGGPAGMEAARVATLRGHKVTLWEKEPRLGGQLIQAVIPPHKDRVGLLTKYLQRQLNKLDVKINLTKTATAAMIIGFKPEVVVIATGVKPFVPPIPGLDKIDTVQAGDVLEGKVAVGNKVVVIGGELVGCETVEFLADKGKKVTVMRRGPEMVLRIRPNRRTFLLNRLLTKGVALYTGVNYNEVTPKGIIVTTMDGVKQTVEADSIVLAAGALPNKDLPEEIKGKVPEIHLIGDCAEPLTIREAISDGYSIGLEI